MLPVQWARPWEKWEPFLIILPEMRWEIASSYGKEYAKHQKFQT